MLTKLIEAILVNIPLAESTDIRILHITYGFAIPGTR